MALLEIKKFGCETLRLTCDPVRGVTEEMRKFFDDMFETMYFAEGIGLAAPQVGINQRFLVLDVGPHDPAFEPRVFVNPEILWETGDFVGEEGCLSLPGIVGDVRRPAQVQVRALDREGKPFEMPLQGMAAKALQHEIDHLNGVLVIDRFSTIRRNLVRGQLRRLQREGKRQLSGLVYRETAGENLPSGAHT